MLMIYVPLQPSFLTVKSEPPGGSPVPIFVTDSTHFRVIPRDPSPEYGERRHSSPAVVSAATVTPTPAAAAAAHSRGRVDTATTEQEEEEQEEQEEGGGGGERPAVTTVGMETTESTEEAESPSNEAAMETLTAAQVASMDTEEESCVAPRPLTKTDSLSKKKGNKEIVIYTPSVSILSRSKDSL